MLLQDARDYQILSLGLFLVLGIGMRDWTLHPDLILVIFITCILTQWLASTFLVGFRNKSQQYLPQQIFSLEAFKSFASNSLRSALITSLSLSLLLRAEHFTTLIVAGVLAILSKFIFQINDKHWFNPANFGIVIALCLTDAAWVSPGQWGEEAWFGLVFLGAGGIVLKRVGRWDTAVTFLGSYAFLEAVRNFWLGWTWDVYAHRMMSGSLLLFALFMITDPKATPNARSSRLIWCVAIAVLTFILRNAFFISDAPFFALFALSPLTVWLDRLWIAPKFSWQKSLTSSSKLSTVS